MKKIALLLVIVLAMAGCATAQLPKNSTFVQKAEAVCSDARASILGTQILLSMAQNSNYDFDYSKAQYTLSYASTTLEVACIAAKTEGDLTAIRMAILQALADAAKQQAEVKKWGQK